ncbi:MAG: transcription antitermination factor NusB [Clostridiales bacterium]|nr:transcription antitermination factor NusB [Clostridiales bacterium]
MGRRQARAAAMQMVYENMLGGDGGEETLQDLIAFVPEDGDKEFIDTVLAGVKEHEEEIDGIIAAHLKDWSMDRIARVDLSILRVAVYEILYKPEGSSAAAAVNEAVTLAQRFDTPESGKFINGLLRSLLREREGEEA